MTKLSKRHTTILNSQNLYKETPEVHTLEIRAYKNMTTERGLCDIISIIRKGYYPKQITQQPNFPHSLYILMQKAVSLTICIVRIFKWAILVVLDPITNGR
jgi:hypothetical protein